MQTRERFNRNTTHFFSAPHQKFLLIFVAVSKKLLMGTGNEPLTVCERTKK